MQLRVFQTEQFVRWVWRYIVFVVIVVAIFVLSIIYNNPVGAVLLFFVLGAYFYVSVRNNKIITIQIQEHALVIGSKSLPWTMLDGYVIEVDTHKQLVKNIVIVYGKNHLIFTINDSIDNVELFDAKLGTYIARLDHFDQTMSDKIIRQLKL